MGAAWNKMDNNHWRPALQTQLTRRCPHKMTVDVLKMILFSANKYLCYYFFLPCPWKRQGSWLGALHNTEFSSLTFLSHSSTFHSGWVTLLPDLTDPVSTRPTMTQPTSGWSCTFRMGSRNGFSSVRLSWIELWCCRILVSHHRYMSGPLDELESRMSRQTVSPLTKCDQNGNLILSTMRSGEVAVLSEMPRH